MAATSFFGDLLQTIGERGRDLVRLGRAHPGRVETAEGLVRLGEDLVSRRGEASGVALAQLVLEGYAAAPREERLTFLRLVAVGFDADRRRLDEAITAYRAEPRSQELIRRLNLAASGSTLALVRMREDLFELLKTLRSGGAEPDVLDAATGLDADFEHLFASWFNRGFLVLRRIDWNSPAAILERLTRYEAVHEIADWNDLRRRIALPDRRCLAFFHPALRDEPLIFVEVALTDDVPSAIGPILAHDRTPMPLASATTAVFYSISNCQPGLAGVTFGNFLIKQVAADLASEIPTLKTFVTLSPAPGFRAWLEAERRSGTSRSLSREEAAALTGLDDPDWAADETAREAVGRAMLPAAAAYFLHAKNGRGRPPDPVARFHLGNGASLDRLNVLGDLSRNGLSRSYGLMVNYRYDLATIERNHEAYADHGTVAASAAVNRALRGDLRSQDAGTPA